MTNRCPDCGRPTWEPHNGLGGDLAPDSETYCLSRGGLWCRVAAAGVARGTLRGVRLAKRHVRTQVQQGVDDGRPVVTVHLLWDKVVDSLSGEGIALEPAPNTLSADTLDVIEEALVCALGARTPGYVLSGAQAALDEFLRWRATRPLVDCPACGSRGYVEEDHGSPEHGIECLDCFACEGRRKVPVRC